MSLKLYSYYRSSAAYRVRIALNLKGLDAEVIPVHLVKDGGQHRAPDYLEKNPQGLVPLLEVEGVDGESNNESEFVSQSLAIIEYLDEVHPEPPLLPGDASSKAQVRALSHSIACDIHPLNNLRVLRYLVGDMGVSEEQKNSWYRHWINIGFTALEKSLSQTSQSAAFCVADQPTMVDCCLVPQVYNARRFNVDMTQFPLITSINDHCLSLPSFQNAAPENQADAD